jgi:hypothetical protein
VTAIARIGLQMSALASVLLCGWLVSVIILVLPDRDPIRRPFWAVVAVLILALAAASFRAVGSRPDHPRVRVILAVVSAPAFGLGVVILSGALRPSAEGYLLVIAAILLANGAFGYGWLIATNSDRRR